MSNLRSRKVPAYFLFAAIAAAGSTALLAPSTAQGGGPPCLAKKFDFAEVKAACDKGGRNEAKKLMKDIEKKAKAAGKKSECKDCHSDQKEYKHKDNSKKDYTELRKLAGYK